MSKQCIPFLNEFCAEFAQNIFIQYFHKKVQVLMLKGDSLEESLALCKTLVVMQIIYIQIIISFKQKNKK